jgi:predicted ester cyclase
MSAEENKQVARRFITAFLAGDTAALEEIIAQNVVDHNPQPGQKPGRQGLIEILVGWRAAFPDLDATILHEVAEGEFVVQHGVGFGTNSGPLMGRAATGKPARFPYMDMHRIVNGRIVEIWHLEDIIGMLYQLGAMSA